MLSLRALTVFPAGGVARFIGDLANPVAGKSVWPLTYLGNRGSHMCVIRSQLLKGTVPFLVLSVLAEGELYGYQIAQRIRDRSGAFLAPSEGSLYPALHRLERDGAVTAEWRAGEQGPRRRYYTLTPTGQRLLAAARDEWREFTGIVSAVAGAAAS